MMNDRELQPRTDAGLCPSREVLSDLTLGKLPPETIEAVGRHVEACAVCQAVLESLDGLEDSLVADLKGHPGAMPADPELEDQIRQAEQISRGVWGDLPPDSPEEPLPVRLGQYDVRERIGRGGMGTVYKARHPHLKRDVAIKVLPKSRLRDPEAVARFQREMEAVGRLDHPHLVRAHDAGESDGQHFLVMEFIDGIDLRNLVRQRGPLPVADACEIVRQAALGLQHAHEHGLIHRDIKPSNLMLTSAGAVKVLDLGLARLTEETATADDMTRTGQIVGTGDFIAPEQGQDTRQADAQSDIYSLGCTLYFLLAGRAPFSDARYDTFMKKVMAHAGEPIPAIRAVRKDVSDVVVAILERMLAKEPDKRFQTAAEVAEAMNALVCGTDLSGFVARQVGIKSALPVPRSSQTHRSHRWLLIALVFFVSVVVIGGWYASRVGSQPHHTDSPSNGELLTMEKAEVISRKIARDMEPDIRKMNEDFARMRGSMREQTKAVTKAIEASRPVQDKRQP